MTKFTLRALLMAAILSGLAMPAFAADVLHVGKAVADGSQHLPIDVGVKVGIFAKHDLDVQISNFSGGSKLHQAMEAGSIDIGGGGGPELALVAKGAHELAVAISYPPVTFIGVSVPADSTARTLDDLKGKKIGVSSAISLTYWLVRELAKKKGWGPDGVDIVSIGNGAASIVAAFRTHAVDADLGGTSTIFNMEADGVGRLLAPVSQYEGNVGGAMFFATKQLIAEHPDLVRRFLAGLFDTIAFMRANKDETVEIESAVTGFPTGVQSKDYDLTIGGFSTTGRFDQESLDNLQQSFTDLKLVDTPPDMKTLYTEEFLPKR